MGKDYEDPEELKEILSVVSTEIPKLIEAITKTMYNTENAQNMAKSVSEFYKTMKEAGMDDKMAYELTQEFMSSFSIGGLISNAVKGGAAGGADRDDLDEIIEKKVREKLKKRLEKDEEGKEDDD
ncbi:MAG: hypothetical protein AB7S97_01730 [Thermoplasmata archaeon]